MSGSSPVYDTETPFRTAIAAMDAGDNYTLEQLLKDHPDLVDQTTPLALSDEIDYFSGAALLHYVAGNPNRGNLPGSIVESAALLLRAGADPNAVTLRGSTTIGLILTSKDASEAGVAPALIELLQAAGAKDDLDNEYTLLGPLRNCAYGTAQQLQQQGYKTGLRAAAGLGLLAMLREMLEAHDPDTDEAETGGLSWQEELDQALTYAVTHSHREAVDVLLQYGANIDSIPAVYGNPGTALHIAPTAEMAQFLIERGADPAIKDPTFNGTPADWSQHCGRPELVEYFAKIGKTGA